MALTLVAIFAAQTLFFAGSIWRDRRLVVWQDLLRSPICADATSIGVYPR